MVLLTGKAALIAGVTNDDWIAWGWAKAFLWQGAVAAIGDRGAGADLLASMQVQDVTGAPHPLDSRRHITG